MQTKLKGVLTGGIWGLMSGVFGTIFSYGGELLAFFRGYLSMGGSLNMVDVIILSILKILFLPATVSSSILFSITGPVYDPWAIITIFPAIIIGSVIIGIGSGYLAAIYYEKDRQVMKVIYSLVLCLFILLTLFGGISQVGYGLTQPHGLGEIVRFFVLFLPIMLVPIVLTYRALKKMSNSNT